MADYKARLGDELDINESGVIMFMWGWLIALVKNKNNFLFNK